MVDVWPRGPGAEPDVLFEDADLIALNKPPGLLVLPDRWDATKPHLVGWLNTAARATVDVPGRYYVVHRLDKDTSGVILFAKHAAAHRALSMAFTARRVRKSYEALVTGEVAAEMGLIDRPIAPHPKKKGVMHVDPSGKSAQTEYHLLARGRGFSFVRLFPRTGRTHQIRVHMQALGHPLAVDPLYGTRAALYRSDLTGEGEPRSPEERPLLDRLSLHASELSFVHPMTRKHLVVQAPLAEDLRRAREVLETGL